MGKSRNIDDRGLKLKVERIMLEEYLNKGIKDVISEFPAVADILEQYNIGCAPCTEGSCLLKDIVDVHNLSPEDEKALMAQIAEVVDSGRPVEVPAARKIPRAKSKDREYSPPLKKLVDEHVLIKELVGWIPGIVENLDLESEEGKRLVLRTADFIRFYADKYHHAKEEQILFKCFDENSEILKTMCEEHEKARGHVRAVLEAVEKKDKDAVAEHLEAYRELLTEHIRKEDEILYPWMDRNLSVTQVGQLFCEFAEVDEKMDQDVIDGCRKFVVELEKEMSRQTKEVTK
jgi:hemerythrin-like domain-containing protein